MDVTGLLKVKGEPTKVSEKFTKREIVITDNSSQYPQHISIVFAQDRCALVDNYQVGQEIKVHFNLRGREWQSPQGETKYFNSLEGWRIESVSSERTPQDLGEIHHEETRDKVESFNNPESDLPF